MRLKTDLFDSLLLNRFDASAKLLRPKQEWDDLQKSLTERAAISRNLFNILFTDQSDETYKNPNNGDIDLMNLTDEKIEEIEKLNLSMV
jgi:hypothetical protein